MKKAFKVTLGIITLILVVILIILDRVFSSWLIWTNNLSLGEYLKEKNQDKLIQTIVRVIILGLFYTLIYKIC
jgi:hypothetical protein